MAIEPRDRRRMDRVDAAFGRAHYGHDVALPTRMLLCRTCKVAAEQALVGDDWASVLADSLFAAGATFPKPTAPGMSNRDALIAFIEQGAKHGYWPSRDSEVLDDESVDPVARLVARNLFLAVESGDTWRAMVRAHQKLHGLGLLAVGCPRCERIETGSEARAALGEDGESA